MKDFVRIVAVVFCFVSFSGISGFAQRNDLQNISTPEASKMFKDHDGLISSSQMQAYQLDKDSESDKGRVRNISRKWKKTKTVSSPETNTEVTGK